MVVHPFNGFRWYMVSQNFNFVNLTKHTLFHDRKKTCHSKSDCLSWCLWIFTNTTIELDGIIMQPNIINIFISSQLTSYAYPKAEYETMDGTMSLKNISKCQYGHVWSIPKKIKYKYKPSNKVKNTNMDSSDTFE